MFAVDLETIHNEVGGELSAEGEETAANGYESVTLKVKRNEKPACGTRVVVYIV